MTFKADFLPTSEERDVPNTPGTGHRAGQGSKKGGVIYVMKVETLWKIYLLGMISTGFSF